MRHIHMEIAHLHKEPPAREGDLPGGGGQRGGVASGAEPEAGPGQGEGPLRPFGEEEIKLQKVYQLSIFSQRRGLADPPEGQRALRSGAKRAPEEPPPPPPAHKRPHLAGQGDDMDSEVLCGPGQPLSPAGASGAEPPHSPNPQSPRTSLPGRRPALHNHHRPLPDSQAPLSPKYQPLFDSHPTHSPKYQPLTDPHPAHSPKYQPLSDPHLALSPKYQPLFDPHPTHSPKYQSLSDPHPTLSPKYQPLSDPHPALSPKYQPLSDPHPVLSPKYQPPSDPQAPVSPRSQSFSPKYQPLLDPHSPLSPKYQPDPQYSLSPKYYQPLVDPQSPLSPGYSPLREPQSPLSPRSLPPDDPLPLPQDPTAPAALPRTEPPSAGGGRGLSPGNDDGSDGSSDADAPARRIPCRPPGSPPAGPLGPDEARAWVESLEASPAERTAGPATSGGSSPTPPCPAKKRLLSSSDTGESCSEDEGPSTSKRSRLALLAPGLGLGACRSTDAKGAPFWNHLLPAARDTPKGSTDGMRVRRRLNCAIRLKSRQLRSGRRSEPCRSGRPSWPSASISHSLLGNFEESILKGRFSPSGRIEGFTAEIGASGSYCPQHATLPVQVTYYDISEHSAPSPFLGVIYLEALGKKGYSVPKAGTIQVTLFNPNKTVVKMFLVTYNFGDMPVNHMTFLRHRIFLVPVEEGEGKGEGPEGGATDRKKILCYLIHLRFQSSKSGKLYLHDDIRLLFSRKSIEVDTGIPYELKSYTEVPKNPTYSPRV
ncbi:pollen-specific leucine-rich repeat extensin-like protein 1 [Anguilla anguilla]|uniref:pollen-specific leucine-rich repeat extensin-like protein 1 n=1 Tax=Anguilla anguilla TaxID=7936 RepID=UPI0015B2ABC2|nr:pollen-specific leucine-rich repeat extensin-like protein 1 [Anguilla anguilla]XP_035235174.1 pollen-specific leucine-rich repeat extensin-like protein 1 [Anguilla anguilla]XP_035235175.1 pollen-specific leucine-rich repeat extensin-like protein 1 [Anguilla anguilla]XP_035235176.1 pollen-specific leucine-rich repeat extensin-like protein 1 [Anguilla anguilla]XP_035235177.1 pollen-specific leucine-rich repeat extensin-like protein 1 [Anguilla anguilla]XP_035235178.1 pollen-specific leucine-r